MNSSFTFFLGILVFNWASASILQARLSWPLVFVGNEVVDLKWSNQNAASAGYQEYQIRRDGQVIASVGIDQDWYRDTQVMAGHDYLYEVGGARSLIDVDWTPPRLAHVGQVEGTLYRTLEWNSGTYTLVGDVEVDRGQMLVVHPGVVLTAAAGVEARLGANSEGVLRLLGARIGVSVCVNHANSRVEHCQFSGRAGSPYATELGLYAQQTIQGCVFSNFFVRILWPNPLGLPEEPVSVVRFQGNTNYFTILNCELQAHAEIWGNVGLEKFDVRASDHSDLSFHGNAVNRSLIYVLHNAKGVLISNALHQSQVVVDTTNQCRVERNLFTAPERYGGICLLLEYWDSYTEGKAVDVSVNNNVFQNYATAIRLKTYIPPITGLVVLEHNTFYHNEYCVQITRDAPVRLEDNCFANTIGPTGGYGLRVNDRTIPVDARRNYWGHPTGPTHRNNPNGQGTAILESSSVPVLFDPYLTEGHCEEVNPTPPDLFVSSISLRQVVEGMDAVVAGKPMIIQAVINSSRPMDLAVDVRCTFQGQETRDFFQTITKDLRLDRLANNIRFSDNASQVVYFPIANVMDSLPATAVVQVDPDNDAVESNESNNRLERTVPQVKPKWSDGPGDLDPEVLAATYVLFTSSSGQSDWTPFRLGDPFWGLRASVGIVPQVFPLTENHYTPQFVHEQDLKKRFGDRIHPALLYRVMKLERPSLKGLVIAYHNDQAALPVIQKMRGLPAVVTVYGYSAANQQRYQLATAATAVRYQVPFLADQITPVQGGLKALWGKGLFDFWILDDALAQANLGQRVVSVLGQRPANTIDWIDRLSYNQLLKATATKASRRLLAAGAGSSELVLVSGTVNRAGRATLDPLIRLPAGSIEEPDPGPYQVALVDAQGQILVQRTFDLDFTEYGSEGLFDAERGSFALALPWAAEARGLTLRYAGDLLASRMASAHPPTVRWIAPQGGESITGQYRLRWESADADLDLVTFQLLYSPDDGMTWQVQATELTGNAWDWDTTRVAGSSQHARLKILATDGFYQAEAFTAFPFSVAFHPLEVQVLTPLSPMDATPDSEIVFQGLAFDPGAGQFQDDWMRWILEPGGILGTGREVRTNLSAGDYMVRLEVNQPGLGVITRPIVVHIRTNALPDLVLAAAEEWQPTQAMTGQAQVLSVPIGNHGPTTTAEVHWLDGTNQLATTTLLAAANAWSTASLVWRPESEGWHTLELQVRDLQGREQVLTNNTSQCQVLVTNPDSDGDALPDWWEIQHFGDPTTTRPDTDPDHDGQVNLAEYHCHTLPTEATSVLRFLEVYRLGEGEIQLTWSSVAGQSYEIWWTSDLQQSFQRIASAIIATGAQRSFTHSIPASLSGYYRVCVP